MSLKMDNDSMEDFFRKATSQYDQGFNEGDWQRMEKMLDEELVRSAAARLRNIRLFSISAVVLTVLGVLTYFFWLPKAIPDGQPAMGDFPGDEIVATPDALFRNDKDAGSLNKSGGSLKMGKAESLRGRERKRVLEDTKGTKINATLGQHKSVAASDELDSGGFAVNQGMRDSEVVNSKPRQTVDGLAQVNQKDQNAVDRVSQTPPLTVQELSKGGLSQEQTDSQEGLSKAEDTEPPETKKVGRDQVVDSVSAVVYTVDAPERKDSSDRTKSVKKMKRDPYGKWSFSLVAAPDFTSTARSGFTSPGDAFGIMIHYRLLSRWSISSGVLRTSKKYWGYGEEYSPPSGYWDDRTNGVVPDRIDGGCVVVEVPVTMSFNILESGRSRIFATAGFSSYMMRSEEYDYTFSDPNPGSAMGWYSDRPSTLWFGIGSLSVGYDFKATPSLSFGLEPYYRIPFEGMGWADLDLYSTGILFAVRYRFLKQHNDPPATKAQ
jgi:hypothetical protein